MTPPPCKAYADHDAEQVERTERWIVALKAERVETCAAYIGDEPGSLALKLNALAVEGANLEFVMARRTSEAPGKAVVFVAPISGRAMSHAAWQAGFAKTTHLHTVRVEGPDKRGQVARITEALALNDLNVGGLSSIAIGNRFVTYIALDSSADAAKAVRILRAL